MIVCPARLSDVDTLLDWRRQRAAWLKDRGEDQWQIPWPRTAISGAVLAGQTWMVWDGDVRAASVTLTAGVDLDGIWKSDKHSPDELWLPSDDPSDALYVSKLMVPLSHAGTGLGVELLKWAAGRAYDAELHWLRLDAWTSNTSLHKWYVDLGFRHVRTVHTRRSGACFQKPAQRYSGWRLKTAD